MLFNPKGSLNKERGGDNRAQLKNYDQNLRVYHHNRLSFEERLMGCFIFCSLLYAYALVLRRVLAALKRCLGVDVGKQLRMISTNARCGLALALLIGCVLLYLYMDVSNLCLMAAKHATAWDAVWGKDMETLSDEYGFSWGVY